MSVAGSIPGRARLFRQLLTEGLLLALAGGALGLVVAITVNAVFVSALDALPRGNTIGLDGAVLAFTALVSLVASLAVGATPALQSSRAEINEVLKEGARGSSARHGLQRALVVVEVALAVILAASAGLMVRTMSHLGSVDPGFDPNDVLVFGVAGKRRESQSGTLLLSGVIVNAFCTAAIMFLISTASGTRLHGIMFWLMGDLGLADTSQTLLGGVALLAGFVVIYLHARSLNLLVIGEEQALQLGVDVEKTRRVLFFAASFITAAAVSLSGLIGFVGLMTPHMARLVLGPDHRLLLPASVLSGAVVMVLADLLARVLLAPVELPVGIITALAGGPVFVWLLVRSRRAKA